MLNVTPQFRQALYDGNRNYIETVKITLTDGTVLNLTNEDIWQGGMSFEDAVSSDSDFQIGTAIINKQKLQINNLYEDYTDYVFEGAEVITNIGLVIDGQGTVERIRKGTFIVDTADYDDTIVTLNLLDKMSLFEKPYSDISITYPSQAQFVITMICNHCGVTLATTNFPHKTFMVTQGPDKDTCSCREVIAWIAQICGCFARCNVYGKLELKWYDTNALDSFISGLDGGVFDTASSASYETGDTADGGSFNPWNTGYEYDSGDFTQIVNNVHVIGSTFSHTISLDDVVVTGLRIVVKNGTGTGSEVVTYSRGTAGYIVEISENGFITTVNADTIADWLATQLIGLRFRKANISIPSDPSIEAGDVGVVFDKRGNQYPILVSKTTFSPYGQQTVVSSAQTPARNSSAGHTVETKNYVELRKQLKEQMSTWEEAEESLREAISNANGLFTTDIEDPQTHAVTHYLHNKGPDGTSTDHSGLNASDIRIMISDVGITMTANGTDQTPTWYGMTVNGEMIASILNTIGLNFDWGTGGTLTLGGLNNENGLMVMLDSNNSEVGRWSNSGIDILKGSIEIPYSWRSAWGATYTGRTQMINRGVALLETSDQDDITVAKLGTITQAPIELHPYIGNYDDLLKIFRKIVRYRNRTTECSFNTLSGRLTVYFNDDESSGEFCASGGYIFVKGTNSFEGSSVSNCSFTYEGNVLQVIRTDSLNQLKTRFRVYLGEDSPYSEVLMDAQLLCTENATFSKNVTVDGNLSATGTKNRLVKTTDYSERYLYCYETTTPVFGDIGEGIIGEDGKVYIQLDPIFLETITTENYQVFIQLYDDGKAYVSERHKSYFVVTGTPNIAFGWEVKAKQSNYENYRLESKRDIVDITGKDYCDLVVTHIKDIMKERGITNESSNLSNSME